MITGSYQKERDGFFKNLLHLDLPKRIISKAAFSKARLKLKYEAFIDLNRRLIEFFYDKIGHATWHGFTLLAIDGTLIRLPRIPKISEHFGAWHPAKGKECPMARAVQLFDPLNGLSIRSVIGPKSRGEREMAADLFLDLLYARVLSKNLTAVLSFAPNQCVKEPNNNKLYTCQINFAYMLSAAKHTLVLLFNRPKSTAKRLISDLFDLFFKTVEPVRPGRKFQRKPKVRRNFYPAYKPIG